MEHFNRLITSLTENSAELQKKLDESKNEITKLKEENSKLLKR